MRAGVWVGGWVGGCLCVDVAQTAPAPACAAPAAADSRRYPGRPLPGRTVGICVMALACALAQPRTHTGVGHLGWQRRCMAHCICACAPASRGAAAQDVALPRATLSAGPRGGSHQEDVAAHHHHWQPVVSTFWRNNGTAVRKPCTRTLSA